MPKPTQSPRARPGADGGRLIALPRAHNWPRRHNVPAPISSFVGRDSELDEVMRLLRDHRLVTLTGPGGAGKTRLALAAAAELIDVFDDGPWVVELGPLSHPSLVRQALATTLGVREQPGRRLQATLSEVLQNRAVLLVLDNCEHLVDACSSLSGTLLKACAGLRILATSREALGLTGEIAWPVPPLSLPARGLRPDLEEVRDYAAIRLFVERVSAVKPSFALTRENTPVVARIAEQLDGIPLALELAAARAKALSLREISLRLDDCFRILDAGERTAVARHRTLHATIDWSHDLLSGEERMLFRRLSVFVDGFTLPAAEAVCPGDGLERDDVLPVLSQLVDKSLVGLRESAGESRYGLLQTIRQYAREQLRDSDEEDVLEHRHATYFLDLAEEGGWQLIGPEQPTWLLRLEAEHENLRAALAWSASKPGEAETGARIAGALWPFWFARGYLSEGTRWLTSTAGRTGPSSAAARAKALNGAALLAAFGEEYDAAKAYGEQSLALYRELADPQGIASSLIALGTVGMVGARSDVDVGACVDEARALQPKLEDRRISGHLLDLEGIIALAGGDAERAFALWLESLAVSREIGNVYGECLSLSNLGLLAVRMGEVRRADELLREGLRRSVALHYELIIQYCLVGLGTLAAASGQPIRAARLWGAADAISEAFGTHLTRATRSLIEYERQVSTVRSQLDESAWDAARAEGRAMDPARTADLEVADEPPSATVAPLPGGLSTRETDVLRLVAGGMTNAEVARTLFLSTRTVDWHLSSIYTKLGFHSRTQATRFAVDHGLV